MFERYSLVAVATAGLHRLIGGVAAEAVASVVAHGDLVGDLQMIAAPVHLPRRFQINAGSSGVGGEFGQRNRTACSMRAACRRRCGCDARRCRCSATGAERRGGLADPILVHEQLVVEASTSSPRMSSLLTSTS